MNRWSVYLLRCADRSLYCGVTTDIERRIKQHRSGKASKYTRSRLPIDAWYHVDGFTKSEALKHEHRIKALRNAELKSAALMVLCKGRRWGGTV